MDENPNFELTDEDRTPLHFDPKLKEAMAEISAIMKKHDIGGHVALMSATHAEFRLFFEPSWSALRWEGDGVRIRAKKADLGSEEAVTEALGATAHMLMRTCEICVKDAELCRDIVKELRKHVRIEHQPYSGFTPHREN